MSSTPTPTTLLQWLLTNDLAPDRARPRPVHAPARSRRRARRRRHHRVVGRRRALLRHAERVQHRRPRGRVRMGVNQVGRAVAFADITATRAVLAVQGPDGAGAARHDFARGGCGATLRGRGGRRLDRRRHRLHGRGRCRAPCRGRRCARGVGRAPRRGHHSGRARRTRHAAPRSRPAAARSRVGSGHHAAAGPARVGRAVGQGRLPRSGRARPGSARPARPACSRASRSTGRQPARDGAIVRRRGVDVGVVTSGNFSPTLGHAIALAFCAPDVAVGEEVVVEVRGRELAATVVALPFYKRA